jgi:autotransporter-associated beta strand protein
VLIKYTGAIGGSGFGAFSLGSLPLGVTANLINNVGNSSVDLQITAVNPVVWTGSVNGDWDIGSTPNWIVGVTSTTYQEPAVPGPAVRFDDSAPGTRAINVATIVSPASVIVSNSSPDYSIAGAGKISGPASLTKQGSGNLSVSTLNDYTGGTVVSAGKLTLAGSDVIPDGAGKGGLTVNGTFDLAGSSDTINGLSGNGTVDVSAGASILTVGSNNASSTFTGTIINGGGSLALTKVGTGTVTLSGNNAYSAGTTILTGSAQVGSGTALGSGQVTLSSGNVSSDSTTARTLNNSFLITTASSLGNATNNGLLTFNGSIDFNAAARVVTYNSDVKSTGTLANGSQHKDGPGTFTMTGTANFTAEAEIRRGTWFLDGGIVTNTAALRPDTTLSPGFARLIVTNGAAVILTGTTVNGRVGYTGGDNTSTNVLDLAGLYRMPNVDSANGITTVGRSGNRGILNFYAAGDLQTRQLLRATTGTGQYGEVNFDGGILRAMNDQASFITGLDLVRIRNGGVTIDDSGFVIGIPQPLLTGGGSGGLTKIGIGTMQLNGTNTYTGTTLVSAGALGGNGVIAGPVSVASGATLSPGTSVGKLTINNTLALSSGSTTFIELDKGALTNDMVVGLTSVTYGGTLSVTNLSGTLVVGDSFQIFSAGAYGGSFSAVDPSTPGPGLAWNTSQLAVNGTLSIVTGVATNPTNITAVVSGGTMALSWPSDHTGWRLEAQTNAWGIGVTTNWSTVSGSTSTNQMQFPIGVGNGSVFFRLVYP